MIRMRRVDCSRVEGFAVADGIRPSVGVSAMVTTFPLRARRTERASFPHSALLRDNAFDSVQLRVRTLGCAGL